MPITQTVEIPDSRRLTIDVPLEVPSGRVILTFTPMAETDMMEFEYASNEEVIAAGDEILDRHLAAFKALAKCGYCSLLIPQVIGKEGLTGFFL